LDLNRMFMIDDPIIKRLIPADAPEYRRLMLNAYRLHPEAFTSSASERSALPLSWWESRLRPGDDVLLVVFGAFSPEDTLLGVAGVGFESREKTLHKSTLFGMYVRPESRGHRLGYKLVEEVLKYARTRPMLRIIQLTVTEGNETAVHLYENCGFRPFGVEPLAVRVGTEFVTKLHMWRNIAE